jgi:LacI family transcriptional regulator
MKTKKLRMVDVAREAGVTAGTISAILRGQRDRIFYSDETRDRVLAVVERMGYRVNSSARSLREGKSRSVGVLIDDITLPFLATLIRATGISLQERGYSILLCGVEGRAMTRETLLHLIHENHLASFLLAGAMTQLSDHDLSEIAKAGYRLVLVERESPLATIGAVRVDNAAGGRLAAEALLKRRARRFLILAGPSGNPMARQRTIGAEAALREAGIAQADIRIMEAGGWTPELGYAAMRDHLGGNWQPDAVVAGNDLLAIGALRAIRERGLSIPEEIAVVGFDDISLAAFTQPPLTTIRQPAERMGQAAAELLLDLESTIALPRLFAPELVSRQSA